MSHDHEDITRKSRAFREKFRDRELDAHLESLTRRLEDADTLYHHFGHLLKHVRASVAHPVRPKHLQGAIEKDGIGWAGKIGVPVVEHRTQYRLWGRRNTAGCDFSIVPHLDDVFRGTEQGR